MAVLVIFVNPDLLTRVHPFVKLKRMNNNTTMKMAPWIAGIVALLACPAVSAEPSPEDIEFFEKQVRPILVDSCSKCHGDRKQEGGLRLDSRASLLKGGDSGPAVVEGKPTDSLLVEAIGYTGDVKMPPKGKLADDKIAALTEWIKRGAPWPQDKAGGDKPGDFDLAARKARQWAFQPIRPQSVPAVKDKAWPRTTIDNFILAKLEAAGLSPAESADRRTLLRRVTYDLIGLPPAPSEIDAFLADESPEAYERVVDRLLASPHYGERWARHWLDLVRFGETRGHEFDFEMPLAFEYRDYVIRALNADVPYDQFVIEHVAGDLLAAPRRHPTERFNESIIGTGFWHLGEATHSPVDIRADEASRADNQIDVFAKTFLAQTLACARCHDHKFDAISTNDYYALSGYLQSSRYVETCVDPPEERLAIVKQLEELVSEKHVLLQKAAAESAKAAGARVSECLLAALAVLRPEFDKALVPVVPAKGPLDSRIAAAAKKYAIETAELAKWVAHLQGPALKTASDPFHLWALLASRPGEMTAEAIAAFVREHIAAAAARAQQEQANAGNIAVFEDFSKENYAGWFVSGEAFGTGPVEPADMTLAAAPQSSAGGPMAHSGLLSNRLEGTLRSRTFTIEKNRILYHMAGKGAKVNLIIDNFQMIRAPIYGGLTINLDKPEALQWHTQDVSKWLGHNAYIELIDPGEGFIAIDRVLFTDEGSPLEPANPVSQIVLGQRDLDSPEKLAKQYGQIVEASLTGWGDAKHQAQGADGRAAANRIVDWFLSSPLEGSLARTATVSHPDFQKRQAEFPEAQERIEKGTRYNRKVIAMIDGSSEDDRVHLRGSPHKFGDVVPRRFLEACSGRDQPAPTEGSGRLELARRMVDSANPLVARVIVNRLWKHHFGEGLVRTPDDFGNMGQPPTHPELLDFLAGEFVQQGWSMKRLHRLLLLSRTYQMSSAASDRRAEEADPQNKLWHHMNLRRLEGEAIRDAILAVSGRLSPQMYGRGVMPHLTAFMIGRGRPGNSGPLDGDGRRTVYLNIRRNFLSPLLLAFDAPIPFSTVGRRSVSNVPAQALALMNNPFVLGQAEVWARRETVQHSEAKDRIQAMYVAAFGRPPTAEEAQNAQAFIDEQSRQYPAADVLRPWADFAHVLFNTKEFIFVE